MKTAVFSDDFPSFKLDPLQCGVRHHTRTFYSPERRMIPPGTLRLKTRSCKVTVCIILFLLLLYHLPQIKYLYSPFVYILLSVFIFHALS